jgi:hypothetical protein
VKQRIIFGGEAGQPFAVEYGIHINDQLVDNRAEIIVYQDLGPDGKPATDLHDHKALTWIVQKIVDQQLVCVRERFIDFYLVQNIEGVGLIARQYEDVPSLYPEQGGISLNSGKKLPPAKAASLLNSIGIPTPEPFD